MVRNQWYVVLESREVKAKPIGVTRMGEKLVFWRDSQGRVHCLFVKCCHRGAALSAGRGLAPIDTDEAILAYRLRRNELKKLAETQQGGN